MSHKTVSKLLAIGNAKFDDSYFEDLRFAGSDADAIFSLLTKSEVAIFPEDISILKTDATLVEFNSTLNTFFKDIDARTLVFFYFAGHGKAIQKDLYLVMRDTGADNIVGSAFHMGQLLNRLAERRVRNYVIVLDCCYAGHAIGTLRQSRGEDEDLDFPVLDQGNGKVVLASSLSYQLSYEDSEIGSGLFTHHFCHGIETGSAATSRASEWISIENVRDYVSREIAKGVTDQEPIFAGHDMQGSLVVARNKNYREQLDDFRRQFFIRFSQSPFSQSEMDSGTDTESIFTQQLRTVLQDTSLHVLRVDSDEAYEVRCDGHIDSFRRLSEMSADGELIRRLGYNNLTLISVGLIDGQSPVSGVKSHQEHVDQEPESTRNWSVHKVPESLLAEETDPSRLLPVGSPILLSPIGSVCRLDREKGFEFEHEQAKVILGRHTSDIRDIRIYLTRSHSFPEVVYAESNYITPGFAYPTKVTTNLVTSLFDIFVHIVGVSDDQSQLPELERWHQNYAQYLICPLLVSPAQKLLLDSAGASNLRLLDFRTEQAEGVELLRTGLSYLGLASVHKTRGNIGAMAQAIGLAQDRAGKAKSVDMNVYAEIELKLIELSVKSSLGTAESQAEDVWRVIQANEIVRTDLKCRIANQLGAIKAERGKLEESKDLLRQLVNDSNLNAPPSYKSMALQRLAAIASEEQDFAQQLECLQHALEFERQLDKQQADLEVVLLWHIVIASVRVNQPIDAFQYAQEALNLATDHLDEGSLVRQKVEQGFEVLHSQIKSAVRTLYELALESADAGDTGKTSEYLQRTCNALGVIGELGNHMSLVVALECASFGLLPSFVRTLVSPDDIGPPMSQFELNSLQQLGFETPDHSSENCWEPPNGQAL